MAAATELEEQKKLVLPYLQRAEEIQAVDPRVAYYCRLFAVDLALKLPKRHKDIDGLLHATLVKLEKDKGAIAPLDKAQDLQHCMNFALNIFRRADKADRAGRGDANTAKAYYAASIFLDILSQFADLGEPLADKQRYAIWRAAEIRKALREGRPPVPPPRDDEADALMAAGAEGGGSFSGPSSSGAADGRADWGPADGAPALPQVPGGRPAAPQGWDSLPSPPQSTSTGGAPSAADISLPSLPDLPPLPDASAPGGPSDGDFEDLPAPPRGRTRSESGDPTSPTAAAGPAVAASLGPRFRPGSRVLVGGPGGQKPEEGTVGMLVRGGPDPLYKVALKDSLVEVPDSRLAPNLVAGKRVTYVAHAGAPGVGAVVLAAQAGAWPPSYLIRCDDNHEVAAPPGSLSMAGDGGHAPPPKSPRQQQDASPRTSADGAPSTSGPSGGYPSIAGTPGGYPSPYGFGYSPSAPAAPPAGPAHPSPPPPVQSYPSFNAPAPGPSAPSHQPPAFQDSLAKAASQPAATQPAAAAPSSSASAATAAAPQLPEPVPGFQPSLLAIQEAQKYAKYAVSSLSFDDVSGAVKYLTDSLRLLTQPSAAPAAPGRQAATPPRVGRR